MTNMKENNLKLAHNDLYPVDAYKKNYIIARSILCDAERLTANSNIDLQKCILLYNMYSSMRDIYGRRSLHTFEYKEINFDSQEFIRKEFPRKKKWDKGTMGIVKYELAYEEISSMIPDADGFGLFEHIRETDIEKCKWIASMYEVLAEAVDKFAKPILIERGLWEDRENFYNY